MLFFSTTWRIEIHFLRCFGLTLLTIGDIEAKNISSLRKNHPSFKKPLTPLVFHTMGDNSCIIISKVLVSH